MKHFSLPPPPQAALVAPPPSPYCLGSSQPHTPASLLPRLHLIFPQSSLFLPFQQQTLPVSLCAISHQRLVTAPAVMDSFTRRCSPSAQLELQTYLPSSGMKRPTSQGRRAQSCYSPERSRRDSPPPAQETVERQQGCLWGRCGKAAHVLGWLQCLAITKVVSEKFV